MAKGDSGGADHFPSQTGARLAQIRGHTRQRFRLAFAWSGPVAGERRGFRESQSADVFGRRGWTRTSDPQLRRLMLYPPELRARTLSW